jgi:outer membrane protein assembly factor BamB
MTRPGWFVVLSIAIAPSLPDSSAGEERTHDWPGWRGAKRDGISYEEGWTFRWPKEGPRKLWQASIGIGFSSCSVQDGFVYTMGHKDDRDTVWCFGAETGEVAWEFAYEAPPHAVGAEGGPTTIPTLDEGRVYTLSRTGHLFCLAADTGEAVWSKNLPNDFGIPIPHYGFAGSPLVEGDSLVINAGAIFAFEKRTGAVIWKTDEYPAGYSSPVAFDVAGRRCLTILNADSLAILDAKTGSEISAYPWETGSKINVATPIVTDIKIFIASGFGMGCVLLDVRHPESPEVVWKNNNMHTHFNSCVCWEGNIYGFDGHVTRDEGFLTCLDFKTGDVNWKERSVRKGSLLIADGKIIAFQETGNLVVAEANPREYTELARAQVLGGRCWSPPTLANGLLYCRNAAGDLICLDLREDTSGDPNERSDTEGLYRVKSVP